MILTDARWTIYFYVEIAYPSGLDQDILHAIFSEVLIWLGSRPFLYPYLETQ
jgi:hypothetical protein